MSGNIRTPDALTVRITCRWRRNAMWVIVASLFASATAGAWYFHAWSIDQERDAARERETALANAILGEAQRAFDMWDVPLAEELLAKCPDALLEGAAAKLRACCSQRMKTLYATPLQPVPQDRDAWIQPTDILHISRDRFTTKPSGLVGSFSADGAYLVASSTREFIRVWRTATGEQVFNKNLVPRELCRAVALSPDGSRLLFCETNGKTVLRAIALPAGDELWRLEGEYAVLLTYSPDGTLFAALTSKDVMLVDAIKGKVLSRYACDPLEIQDLAFRSDSQCLAVVRPPTTFLDTRTGKEVYPYSVSPKIKRGACFAFTDDPKGVVWLASVGGYPASPVTVYRLIGLADGAKEAWSRLLPTDRPVIADPKLLSGNGQYRATDRPLTVMAPALLSGNGKTWAIACRGGVRVGRAEKLYDSSTPIGDYCELRGREPGVPIIYDCPADRPVAISHDGRWVAVLHGHWSDKQAALRLWRLEDG